MHCSHPQPLRMKLGLYIVIDSPVPDSPQSCKNRRPGETLLFDIFHDTQHRVFAVTTIPAWHRVYSRTHDHPVRIITDSTAPVRYRNGCKTSSPAKHYPGEYRGGGYTCQSTNFRKKFNDLRHARECAGELWPELLLSLSRIRGRSDHCVDRTAVVMGYHLPTITTASDGAYYSAINDAAGHAEQARL